MDEPLVGALGFGWDRAAVAMLAMQVGVHTPERAVWLYQPGTRPSKPAISTEKAG